MGLGALGCSLNIALSQFLLGVIVLPRARFNRGKRAWFPALIRALAGGDADKVAM
jgi:hypothetical protein